MRGLIADECPEQQHQQILEEYQHSRLLIIEECKCRTEEHVICPAASQKQKQSYTRDAAENCRNSRPDLAVELQRRRHHRYVQAKVPAHQHE